MPRVILAAVINNDNTKAMTAGIYRAVTKSHVLYYVHIISCHLHSGTTWYRWDSNTLPVCLRSHAAFLHHAGYRKETQSPDMSEDGGPGWFRTEDSDLALWSQRPLWPGPAHVLSADPRKPSSPEMGPVETISNPGGLGQPRGYPDQG